MSKIEELGKLTDSLKAQILAAEKLTEVEDLYLPYKEKRRTKATIAKENGLFPLAQLIVKNSANLEEEAEKFVNENFTSPQKLWKVLWISCQKRFLRMHVCAHG